MKDKTIKELNDEISKLVAVALFSEAELMIIDRSTLYQMGRLARQRLAELSSIGWSPDQNIQFYLDIHDGKKS